MGRKNTSWIMILFTDTKKEEISEVTNTDVDESNVVEKNVSTEIKEIEKDTSSFEI